MPEKEKRSAKAGLPPGTPIHIGEKKTEKTKITVIDYNEQTFQEKEVEKPEDCYSFKESKTITWINIDGIHDISLIGKIGKHFELHSLILEDIVNTEQRPKTEEFEKHLFIVVKMLYYNGKTPELIVEQVSFIAGDNFLISFQEKDTGDVFNAVRERLRKAKARFRKSGSDYLLYSLIDAIVDNYFTILEKEGERIETMEESLLKNPSTRTLHDIHSLKRELILLRKAVWPMREVISYMQRTESPLIKKTTKIYLRDLYDHTIQVIDTIETYRDMTAGMIDLYMSSLSNKMNEIMKVLTIIATIFIPLTFVVGIYGMNFKNMPELEWQYGYPAIMALMFLIAYVMINYFRQKKWL